ncbi:MAG TPA: OmpH family outer membrane protein [Gemmatimonadales bacterium]|nr:OmpH family outer membrane protein [Gemmatimonadales bacterium]
MRSNFVSVAAVAAVAALAGSVAVPTLARAQGPSAGPAAPLKIAYINSREIMQRTPGYAAAESTYLKEVDGYRTEVQKLQTSLDSAVQALDQQSIALSPAARAAKQKDLQAMQQRMEARTNELQDKARQREQELLQPIQARVQSVIQGIRAESNYSLILDADAAGGLIAAADPALNITARVVQRLAQAQ